MLCRTGGSGNKFLKRIWVPALGFGAWAFDFAFFVCPVGMKAIQSAEQPFNPHFRPSTANHLATPYSHAISPSCLLALPPSILSGNPTALARFTGEVPTPSESASRTFAAEHILSQLSALESVEV